jgi:RHS repeat-associated protein
MEYTFTGQMSYMDDPITSETTEGFGLMFFNARWLDPAIGRFTQADSIVPGGVQGLDRYAYANNSPLVYIDPSGHDPNPWNPFQFNILILSFSLDLRVLGGVTISGNIIADKNTIFSDDRHGAITAKVSYSAGIQGVIDGRVTGYGTNESVESIVNNHVSTILDNGVIPVDALVCDGVCVGLGYEFDPSDPNWHGNTSVKYTLGGGEGGALAFDIAEAQDWILYDPKGSRQVKKQVPIHLSAYAKEAFNDAKIIVGRLKELLMK